MMQNREIKDFYNLTSSLDELKNEGYDIFRGHANLSWDLVPKIFRRLQNRQVLGTADYSKKICQIERDIYRSFSAKSRTMIASYSSLNYLEILCFAQHYGTPTRLLDWTLNYLVAVYFAISTHLDKDGVIWCVNSSRICAPSFIHDRPISKTGIYRCASIPVDNLSFLTGTRPIEDNTTTRQESGFIFFEPPYINERIKNQQGLFSVFLSFSDADFVWNHRLYLQEHERDSNHILYKIVIPAQRKEQIAVSLNELIRHDFIFPDLAGLGMQLSYELDNCFDSIFLS